MPTTLHPEEPHSGVSKDEATSWTTHGQSRAAPPVQAGDRTRSADRVFRGEREDLEDLIGNLAENACKYGGGLVEISTATTGNNQFEILIDDDGEGLNDVDAVAALKRGARLDETLPGSGLGLSICDELARAYGGSLHLERSPLGGLRARLSLPLAETV